MFTPKLRTFEISQFLIINLIVFFVEWPATDQQLPGKVVLSIGMGIVVLLSIPLGYYNLDDNVVVQNAALVVIVISCLGIRQLKTSHHGRSTIRE